MGIMINKPEPDTYTELINFRRLGGDKPRRYTDGEWSAKYSASVSAILFGFIILKP